MHLNKVDFPALDGPIKPMTSPLLISMEISSMILLNPMFFLSVLFLSLCGLLNFN